MINNRPEQDARYLWIQKQKPSSFRFFVPGTPGTAGSKRGMPIYRGKAGAKQWTGKTVVIPANTKGQRLWMSDVKIIALQRFHGPLITGALSLEITFWMPRPKSHYGTGKNADKLKPSAPVYHCQDPDGTKMVRAIEDAMTGVIYRDDNQIVSCRWRKYWVDRNSMPGAEIIISHENNDI